MLQSFTAPVEASTASHSVENAEKEKLVADMNYDVVLLQKEARAWSTYLTQSRLFNAETHNAKVQEREAICELASGHMLAHEGETSRVTPQSQQL